MSELLTIGPLAFEYDEGHGEIWAFCGDSILGVLFGIDATTWADFKLEARV